ncbi:cell surface protein [Blastochloris sulfoviridis]|uniref:Cell surface protein n=1 Tax=Blastochloris sulfoviridis TaxID=50712 RepID=A0A5M6I4B5_9HYPH|nr:cell surface protein [Blastochloris sulfoviridis]KAA5602655.1 cell surface protein [Blastochloris sulfoviridis]
MADVIPPTSMQYLDRAVGALRDVGLAPEKTEPAPINALLEKISDLDPDKIQVIARTLGQASLFNEVVREQIAGMEIGQRYEQITAGFNSIRDDAKRMVDQIADSKLDILERATNVWMKIARGDIADRFDKIKAIYLDVTQATKGQIDREHVILEAYRDFRGALKQSEVLAFEVLATATKALERERSLLAEASAKVAGFAGTEPAERAKLELARDEQIRRVQDEERRYQIAKDLSDNLTISYNTSEVVMARLQQTTNAKERIYAQSISFFSTNDTVLTALKASFTGMFGLHESTATLDAMKEGISKSLETLSEVGSEVQEAAIRSGYGPTVRADAVKKLVDSVVSYQERAQTIIDEMRQMATKNSAEIRDAVEDGKRRVAKLVADGKALSL